jgi:thiamine pyrophosphokinase
MVEVANLIEFGNLSSESKKYQYNIMIVLNRPVYVDQYILLRKLTDYVVCADGAANRLYELEQREKYYIR